MNLLPGGITYVKRLEDFVGTCSSSQFVADPWYPNDVRYPKTREYTSNLPPLPVPFSWGPNGSLKLLAIMEAPILVAAAIWFALQ